MNDGLYLNSRHPTRWEIPTTRRPGAPGYPALGMTRREGVQGIIRSSFTLHSIGSEHILVGGRSL